MNSRMFFAFIAGSNFRTILDILAVELVAYVVFEDVKSCLRTES